MSGRVLERRECFRALVLLHVGGRKCCALRGNTLLVAAGLVLRDCIQEDLLRVGRAADEERQVGEADRGEG